MSEQAKATGPLAGVKVVDMSSVVFGPLSTQILGDLGADVIKIENGKGDTMRYAGKSPAKGMGPIFMALNRNKKSLNLDLKNDEAKEAMRRLLKDADVFFHNVRLAGMERLGFGYEDVKKINPGIVYVHCCGFSAGGAYDGRQAYDDLVQCASGLADLLPLRDGTEPSYMPTLVADKTAGLYGTYATIAALFHKERTGEGQFVEVPMFETVTHMNMVENLYGQTFVPSTYGVAYTRSINPRRKPYKTKDGYIGILPYSDDQWEQFFELGGRPGVFQDERFATYEKRTENTGALYGIIEEVAQTKTTDEWLEILAAANIPVMRFNKMAEVQDDPHMQSIDFFEQREHPDVGTYRAIRHPINFGGTPANVRIEPRQAGADTDEVLADLGFGPDEIAAIKG
ncbi:MAG: CoA transferase [Alphaproteobacteria bacterium]